MATDKNYTKEEIIEFIQERINIYESQMKLKEVEGTDTFRSYFARVNELRYVLDSIKDKIGV